MSRNKKGGGRVFFTFSLDVITGIVIPVQCSLLSKNCFLLKKIVLKLLLSPYTSQ